MTQTMIISNDIQDELDNIQAIEKSIAERHGLATWYLTDSMIIKQALQRYRRALELRSRPVGREVAR